MPLVTASDWHLHGALHVQSHMLKFFVRARMLEANEHFCCCISPSPLTHPVPCSSSKMVELQLGSQLI